MLVVYEPHLMTALKAAPGWHAVLSPRVTFYGLENSAVVRFSLLALSSIFFLVDPFAALPTFLAVTAGVDKQRRRAIARKASITAWVVLSAFAVAGQYIFKMFGITLPAFEIAGGIILLLIGLDMLNAKRSATQETGVEAEAAASKEDAGIVPLGIPMLAGPGSITSVMVLVGQAQGRFFAALCDPGSDPTYRDHLLSRAGELGSRGHGSGRYRHSYSGANNGIASGRACRAVLRQRHGRSRRGYQARHLRITKESAQSCLDQLIS